MAFAFQPGLSPFRWFLFTAVLSLPFLYLPGLRPGLAVLAFLLILSLSPVFFRGLKGGEIHVRYSPTWIPLALAFLFSMIHLAFSPDPYYSADFQFVFLLVILLLIILNLHGTVVDPLPLVLIWCLAESAVVVFQMVKGFPAPPSGTLINRNYLVTLYLSFTGYSIGDLAKGGARGRRAGALWIVALTSTLGILAIGSRSGIIGLVILWAVAVAWFRGRARAVVLALLILVFILPLITQNRAVTVSEHDPYAYSRVDIWRMAVRMGMDHPIAGVGPDLFSDYSPQYAFPVEGVPVRFGRLARKPHSDYLRVWAEGGIVGVFLAVLFLVAVAGEILWSWRDGRAGPVLALAPFFFQALFHDLSMSEPMILIFMVWLHFIQGGSDNSGNPVSLKGMRSMVVVSGIMLSLFAVLTWNLTQSVSDKYWDAGREVLRSQPRVSEGYLEKAALYSPFNPAIARDLGFLYLLRYDRSGNFEDYRMAETCIIRSWELNRNDPAPFLRLAALYTTLAEKNPDAILTALRAAESALGRNLELNPDNAVGALRMARIQRMQGDIPAALRYVERALLLEPNYLQAHREQIILLAESDAGKVEAARESFRSAMERIKGYRPQNGYESELLK